MARFHDKVGFLIPRDNQETGIADNVPVEKPYYGKILEHSRGWETGDNVNDDLRVSNQISITANDFAFRYMSSIGYVRWKGAYWKVVSLRVKGPDIILTLGGVWNGPTAAAAGTA